MESKDITLVCHDCKQNYVFGVEEQNTFRAKGHTHPPKRCPACRTARAARKPVQTKDNRDALYTLASPSANRQRYNVTCTECGKETQVPFEPRAGRPVYCSDCYHKSRSAKQ
ncbi:MAG TPA: CxxC-x17-CxxC domain-containing protein [Dehalococcoidales bacterium]|nr:CxxC-x17-CxxC domain-containing protein [Dehalococcoidales bacterium]